jgi:hypothetical protein
MPGDGSRPGRQPDARGNREIECAGYRTDLPFDRRGHVGKARTRLAADAGEVGWQIDQHLKAWRYAQPKPTVGTVSNSCAILRRQIYAVLVLQAACWYHEAGVRNVRPIGGDLGTILRAVVIGGQSGRCTDMHERE